ncbi:regulator of chromosome condensation 1/beta-lactamase-inhibitor protein II, partial [Cunninghamella echinulata]
MNKLYGFGSNGNGQLGIGHLEDINKPQPCIGIPTNEKIKKIVGGGNHSIVLTKSGKVYITGSSQLGSQQQKIWEKEQQKNTTTATTTSLINQNEYTFPWTIYQERWSQHIWQDVFGVGSSKFGELGSIMKEDQLELKRIAPDILKDIQSVACGWRHSVALDRHGNVYGWGWGKHGQLGPLDNIVNSIYIGDDNDKGKKSITKPTYIVPPFKICLPEKIAQIACGHLHTLFLNHQRNKIYGCGSNKYGQVDTSAPLTGVCKIATGWHSSLILTTKGELYMWGRGDHSQLQHGLKEIKNIVAGSEHILATLCNGEIFAWGWNEHGNCTTEKDDVSTPESIKILDIEDDQNKNFIIGAGCGTSFI